MNLNEFFSKIDFGLLKEQKEQLISVIDWAEGSLMFSERQFIALQGLLELTDYIQDTAVDILGYDENIVFNLSQD